MRARAVIAGAIAMTAISAARGLDIMALTLLYLNLQGYLTNAAPWLTGALALILVFGVGQHILFMAFQALRRGILNQHVLLEIGAFAGIAGGLYAHHKQFLSPTGLDFMKSIGIVVMVILGGMGRTAGVICAAILLTLLPELLRGFADYRMIIYSLLIIGLMVGSALF